MASTGSAARAEDVREWGQRLDTVARRIGARFARGETRDRARSYLDLGPGRGLAEAGLAPGHDRRGEQGAAAIRPGVGGDRPRPGSEVATAAPGPQGPRRQRGAGLRHRSRAGPHDADSAGQDGRGSLVDRGGGSSRPSRRSGRRIPRFGAGPAGIGTSPDRCRLMPSWRASGSGRPGRRKRVGFGRELIAVTVPEARRLLVRLPWSRLPEVDEVLDWSERRRARPAFARRCHDQKRGTEPPD